METIPSFFHGTGEIRARKKAGWTGRQSHRQAKPSVYRILRRRDWENFFEILQWFNQSFSK